MAALPPIPPLRANYIAGSAVRNGSSSRLARWQPYFANCHSIPNKRALPSLVRLHQLLISPACPAAASDTPPQATLPILHSRPTDQQTDALSKPHRKGSQLPTPNSSPPGTPPTLLEQTSSSYVLELSLAILASIYFQPGYQQASPNLPSSRCDADSATRAASPSLPALSTPRLELSTLLPVTPTSVSRTVPSQKPQKHITPLTPQSPCPILKPAALPPLPPTFQLEPPIHVQSLPSKRELTRHLSALGALEPQPGAAPAGSMRWFLTELFKRAALPGLIIRVAAGYVLRCRAAINCAMQTVALKNQLATSDVSLPPADRTPQERVLTDARRVFLAALVLACKFVFDKPYDNRSWSLISGLGSRDIGVCGDVVSKSGWRGNLEPRT
ncbi:hypothetical protein RSAG8_05824, partial [Rhizoctonia solani AG-8 WAC10335]